MLCCVWFFRFGSQSLTLSKIVPHICNLLGDPTSQVRPAGLLVFHCPLLVKCKHYSLVRPLRPQTRICFLFHICFLSIKKTLSVVRHMILCRDQT